MLKRFCEAPELTSASGFAVSKPFSVVENPCFCVDSTVDKLSGLSTGLIVMLFLFHIFIPNKLAVLCCLCRALFFLLF